MLLIVTLILVVQTTAVGILALPEDDYTPQELSLQLYSDGVMDVRYKVDVDPTVIGVNVSLLGSSYENMLVKDQDEILLKYMLFTGHVKIDTFGSRSLTIEYTTSDLTSKTGSLWLLNLDVPVNVNIQLPKRGTIIGLAPTPIGISIIEETVSLIMPAGALEVNYVLGVVGTREHALALINEAEDIIVEKTASGVNVADAQAILQQAKDAYDEEQYIQAEQYAEQAKTSALEMSALASAALLALESAASEIDVAESSGRTSMVDDARDELTSAQSAYESGEYSNAKEMAERAIETAQNSEKPSNNISIYLVAALGLFSAVALISLRKKPSKEREMEEKSWIDLQKLFSQYPHLRLDEREVIKFIASTESGVFVSELRRHFYMPKSSAWRMIRRLEGEEIIITSSVGRETFIQIHPKHGLSLDQAMEPEFQKVPAGSYY